MPFLLNVELCIRLGKRVLNKQETLLSGHSVFLGRQLFALKTICLTLIALRFDLKVQQKKKFNKKIVQRKQTEFIFSS